MEFNRLQAHPARFVRHWRVTWGVTFRALSRVLRATIITIALNERPSQNIQTEELIQR